MVENLRLEHIKGHEELFDVGKPILQGVQSAPISSNSCLRFQRASHAKSPTGMKSPHYPFRIASQSYVLSLLVDGVTIEVRSANTGDVVSRYSIPQSPLIPKTMLTIDSLSHGKSWIQWRSDPFLYTDALTGETLPVARGLMLLNRDLDGNRLITLDTNAGGSIRKSCIVLDATTGEELNRFEIAIGRSPFFLRLRRLLHDR